MTSENQYQITNIMIASFTTLEARDPPPRPLSEAKRPRQKQQKMQQTDPVMAEAHATAAAAISSCDINLDPKQYASKLVMESFVPRTKIRQDPRFSLEQLKNDSPRTFNSRNTLQPCRTEACLQHVKTATESR